MKVHIAVLGSSLMGCMIDSHSNLEHSLPWLCKDFLNIHSKLYIMVC